MKNKFFKRLSVSTMALITTLSMLPAIPVSARNLEWETIDGKDYWYENDVKMGVYGAPGNVWYDGTERGKEIYDPGSNAWYWLDACYDGAKATGKEVFMPYIYGNEKELDYTGKYNLAYESNTCEENLENAKLGYQIWQVMVTGTGKWVRYDEYGRMIKGWVTIEGPLAECYPNQAGNIYYYDRRTGIMAKGIVEIDGKHYEFDRITGVLIGETDKPTDEEEYRARMAANSGKSLVQVSYETFYTTPREGDRDRRIVYKFEDPNAPTTQTSSETFTNYNGEYLKTGESVYRKFTWNEGQSRYSSNREVSSKSWSMNTDTNQLYLSQECEYRYDENNPSSYNYTYRSYTYYNSNGNKTSSSVSTYEYDANGNTLKQTEVYTSYDASGNVTSTNNYVTDYVYEDGRLVRELRTQLAGPNDSNPGGVCGKNEYYYDENGNRIRREYYYNTQTYTDGKWVYSGNFVLSEVTTYAYEKVADKWRNTLQETYAVENGVVTDQVRYRTVYKYDDHGTTVYYRYYYAESQWDSEKGEYVYSDPCLSYGYDDEYQYIPDSRYSAGYRSVYSKETVYRDVNKDGVEEVNYYRLMDTEFVWSVDGLDVGQTKTKTDIAYNTDNTEYYRNISTYEVRAY